jgi:hypothetical protein
MSIHSWLLFTLIACWLAISEEMSLKSIISLLLYQIPWISFSWSKSSNQVQRCVNGKDIKFQASKKYQEFWFSRWYDPMWIISITFLFTLAPQFSLSSFIISYPVKIGVSGFVNWTVRFWTPDSALFHRILVSNPSGHVRLLKKS